MPQQHQLTQYRFFSFAISSIMESYLHACKLDVRSYNISILMT